jgi:hypothetical protein
MGQQPRHHHYVPQFYLAGFTATGEVGNAIDNTWSQPGVVYAGVPFKSSFVNSTALKNRAIVSLLDGYQNNYPLRGDLGDRPDEWLDLRGRRLMKVAE